MHYSLDAYLAGMVAYLALQWRSGRGVDQMEMKQLMDDKVMFIFFTCAFVVCYTVYLVSNLANRCKDGPYKKIWAKYGIAADCEAGVEAYGFARS